jgi:hypothetical protein
MRRVEARPGKVRPRCELARLRPWSRAKFKGGVNEFWKASLDQAGTFLKLSPARSAGRGAWQCVAQIEGFSGRAICASTRPTPRRCSGTGLATVRSTGTKLYGRSPSDVISAIFVCRENLIVIEVDGGQHSEPERDEARDGYLRNQGYPVMRLWNNDVPSNIEGVLSVISDKLREIPQRGSG